MKKLVVLVIFAFHWLATEQMIAQTDSYNIELFMHTANAEGQTLVFDVTVPIDRPIWNPETRLIETDNFTDPASLTIEGNDTTTLKGWHTDEAERIYDGNPCLQWTYEYKIKVRGKDTELIVETLGFHGWDKDIMYDYNLDKYFYWIRGTKTLGAEITTTLYMRDGPDHLQPTPPQNFHCTNPTAYGQHPQFAWSAPEEPDGVTFYYNIYRDLGAGYRKITANPLTTTEYTDTGIDIIKFGANTAHYYVTAKASESPESEASDIVDIKTNTAEKMVFEQQMPDNQAANFIGSSPTRLLGNYPNPFNPSTTIQYALPNAAPVTLKIYNLKGEVVKTLVNGYQTAQYHRVEWNGDDEAGQKVAAGIYLCQLQSGSYKQTMRLILMK